MNIEKKLLKTAIPCSSRNGSASFLNPLANSGFPSCTTFFRTSKTLNTHFETIKLLIKHYS